MSFQNVKSIVRSYQNEFDNASTDELEMVLEKHTHQNYLWRGMHPFNEVEGSSNVISKFWKPFHHSFKALQRREDFFFAGVNDCETDDSLWVLSAGNFMGLFDNDWLGIAYTGKLIFMRYAEFHKVVDNKISETALFVDILYIMKQAGQYPLPPMTGAMHVYPGPKTHDGQLDSDAPPEERKKTIEVINKMVDDLSSINKNDSQKCSPDLLRRSWVDDMVWFGPCGIGASYTIERYQKQHQYPFRNNLTDKVFNGHVARLAEGNYGAFFGWPNLNNRNVGNFMGMISGNASAEMRVVDIYRRCGDKLAENWIYIDMLHYFHTQGLDILKRHREMRPEAQKY